MKEVSSKRPTSKPNSLDQEVPPQLFYATVSPAAQPARERIRACR